MSKMSELYAKVAADSALQEKYYKIVEEASDDEAALGEKLIAFAKEQGFDVTLSDVEEFYKSLAEPANGQLSEEELDSVAGGKMGFGQPDLSALLRQQCRGGGGGGGLNSVISLIGGCRGYV